MNPEAIRKFINLKWLTKEEFQDEKLQKEDWRSVEEFNVLLKSIPGIGSEKESYLWIKRDSHETRCVAEVRTELNNRECTTFNNDNEEIKLKSFVGTAIYEVVTPNEIVNARCVICKFSSLLEK